jgi:hypothetical protein
MLKFNKITVGFALMAALIAPKADEPAYTVGARKVVLGDKAGGLTQFPETPITILQTTPEYKVLIASGLRTVLAKGPSMDKLVASGVALAPTPGKGIDEVSAHISGVWKDPASSDMYAVFNANDSDGVPRIPSGVNGYRGRYFTTAVAKSTDGGSTFKKVGAILSIPKNAVADPLQGDAFASVVVSKDKKYLYAYYGDMYNAMIRGGVQTCMARATLESKGLPGAWKKWYDGDFKTNGISLLDSLYNGAETTPVVTSPALYGDAMYPHVTYSPKIGSYIMVYSVNVFDELHDVALPGPDTAKAEQSGIFIAYSKDGINWVGNHQLNKAIVIDYPGREVAMHPTLVIDEATSSPTALHGILYYGYNANMWFGTPSTQYLASQSIDITGITEEMYTAGIAPKAAVSSMSEYTLRNVGNGAWTLNFKHGDVKGLRLIDATGAEAGKVSKVGQGSFRLMSSHVSSPLFIQGIRNNHSFTKALMLP